MCFSMLQKKLTSMFNYRLTIVLLACFVLAGCGALSPSRPVTKALSCAEDPYYCSIEKLCHFATTGTGTNKTWDTVFPKHVNVAKQRGLTCGVATYSKEICRNTPTECSTTDLCHFATTGTGANKTWDNVFMKHVKVAKQRGLTCGVKVVEKKLCKNDPKQCDAQRLCFWATVGPVGEKKWHNLYESHVREAKKRSLNCNVKAVSGSGSLNNKIPKVVNQAIDRLKRNGKLNESNAERLNQKLKKMEPAKLRALNARCKQAFENIQPSICENELLDY